MNAEKRGKEVRYTLTEDLSRKLRAIADALDVCCPPSSADGGNDEHENEDTEE